MARGSVRWARAPPRSSPAADASVPRRAGAYTADDIARWADTIARDTAACRDVFVYFKHEEEGKGPEFARLLMTRLALPTGANHLSSRKPPKGRMSCFVRRWPTGTG